MRLLLAKPEFAYPDQLGRDDYRELVLRWTQILADEGLDILSYPEPYGSANPGSFVAVFAMIGHHDLSLLTKFGVQFGLFSGSIAQLGTARHHDKDLAGAGSLALPGCFVMTETGHGSNVRDLAGSSRQYRRIALRLTEEGYRCVVIDLPAHGIEAGRSTHAFEMADAIEIAGNALGKVDIVVAHSLGAMATAVAMQRSLRADRLVLVAPGLRPHQALESFAATLRLRPVVAKAVEHSMEDRFGEDLWDRMPKGILDMSVPGRTLIIHDVDDDMVPIEEAKLLSESWGVGLVSTRGYGHNGVLRASEVIDQIVTLASAQPVSA